MKKYLKIKFLPRQGCSLLPKNDAEEKRRDFCLDNQETTAHEE